MCRLIIPVLIASAGIAHAQGPCTVEEPRRSWTIRHVSGSPEFTLDPAQWSKFAATDMSKDCSRVIDYPRLRAEIRGFWTDTHLYLLFRCPYDELNLFLPPQNDRARLNLWDRDVVEMFLGDDWTNIRHYREFEIAPTGDWIDLAIDLERNNYDHSWRSGWTTAARIDREAKVWYAAARIPLHSVSQADVRAGTRWRMNLYRIEGLGPDSKRHFLCWQPTCVLNRDPNHVPEHFGTLVFAE